MRSSMKTMHSPRRCSAPEGRREFSPGWNRSPAARDEAESWEKERAKRNLSAEGAPRSEAERDQNPWFHARHSFRGFAQSPSAPHW